MMTSTFLWLGKRLALISLAAVMMLLAMRAFESQE